MKRVQNKEEENMKYRRLALGNALFLVAWSWVCYNVFYQFETFQYDKYYWPFVTLVIGIPVFLIVVNVKAWVERK